MSTSHQIHPNGAAKASFSGLKEPQTVDARARLLNQSLYRIMTKKHGLKMSADTTKYLAQVFADFVSAGNDDCNDAKPRIDLTTLTESLDYIAQHYVQQQGGTAKAVDHESMQNVVNGIFLKGSIGSRDARQKQPASNSSAIEFKGNVEDQGMNRYENVLYDPSNEADEIEPTTNIQEISQCISIIDAYQVPHNQYWADKNTFISVTSKETPVASADSRTALFRDRFDLLKQRLLRNEAFRVPTFTADDSSYFQVRLMPFSIESIPFMYFLIVVLQITPIIHLKGKKPGRYLLFGMLTSIQDGNYHLEDTDAFIQLEFQKIMQQGPGMITRNCFMLIQGDYTDQGTFKVDVIGHPLPERREDSISAFGNNVDFFGGARFSDEQHVLEKIELDAVDISMVFISDVWLDQTRVLDKLRILLKGFSDAVVPLVFVFSGNFSSTPYIYNGSESKRYKEGFDNLADLISEFPLITEQAHFVFVPGPHDPWAPNILPRAPIPKSLTEKIRQKVLHTYFTTSPCRIKYCTQEIVIFRDDLVNTMRRHCILPVSENHDSPLEGHLVSTLLDQSHLIPLPIDLKPRYWDYDHALRLYPQPHLLILADKYDPYQQEYEGTLCANPGSFPNTGYQFLMYHPSSRKCEPRQVHST
ncbi:DNA-directed DNA polymerase epsilon, subunit B [Batrachochytrium dendrobatidis]